MSNEKLLHEFDQRAVAKALLQACGVKTGLWRLAVKFSIGSTLGKFKDEKTKEEHFAPAVIAGLDRLAMIEADSAGPLVYDAAALLADTKVRPQKLEPKKPAAKKPAASIGKPRGRARKRAMSPT